MNGAGLRHPAAGLRSVPAQHPRVLLLTEGTYPYVLGGVSSWCQLLLQGTPDIQWSVLPVIAGNRVPAPMFDLPANTQVLEAIDLWSMSHPGPRLPWGRAGRAEAEQLPSRLLRGLLGWDAEPAATLATLLWCRANPGELRPAFRSQSAWTSFLDALADLLRDDPSNLDRPFDHLVAAQLYQTLYWVARTAATPTPPCDVLHATAAGWSVLPAIVHKALNGTPLLLTEHGLYMREAYLSAIIEGIAGGERLVRTRLARGLALLGYAFSDVLAPVSDFNARWEIGNGVDARRIRVVPNGVDVAGEITALPRNRTVVSVGRIDPLKDVLTMLRVARHVVTRRPDVTFLHFGPVSPGQQAYGRACSLLHEQLGLGERFRFMGPTRDPAGAVRSANVALLTSISEGMPLALLEAMAQARPVVATSVGGVPEVVRGCGLLAPPGNVERLAASICTLLDDPPLALTLALRGRARVARRFNQEQQLDDYRGLLHGLAGGTTRRDVEGLVA